MLMQRKKVKVWSVNDIDTIIDIWMHNAMMKGERCDLDTLFEWLRAVLAAWWKNVRDELLTSKKKKISEEEEEKEKTRKYKMITGHFRRRYDIKVIVLRVHATSILIYLMRQLQTWLM